MNVKQLLLRNILWQGLQVLSAFVLNLLMARKFGAELNGQLNYLQFVYSGIILLLGISLESSLTYYAASRKIKRQSLAWFALWLTIIATVIMVVIMAGFYYMFRPDHIPPSFRWALFYVTGYLLINNYTALFYAGKNVLLPNLIKLLANTGLSVMLVFFVYEPGDLFQVAFFNQYMIAFLLCGLIIAAAYFFSIRKSHADFSSLPVAVEREAILRYAFMACFTNIVFFLVSRIDYYFVDRYCTEDALGNYTQVSRIVQYFQMIPVFVSAALFPAMASGMISEDASQIKQLNRIIFTGNLILVIVVALSGKWLFPFLYGDTYNSMFIPFLLLVPGILALSNMYITCSYFAGKEMIYVNLIGNVIGLIIILAGDMLLVPVYGIMAAAAVSSIGYLANMIYVMYRFNIKTGSRWKDSLFVHKFDINKFMFR